MRLREYFVNFNWFLQVIECSLGLESLPKFDCFIGAHRFEKSLHYRSSQSLSKQLELSKETKSLL